MDSLSINSTLVKITPKLLLVLLFLLLLLPGISLLVGFNLGFHSHLHTIDYFYIFLYRWAISLLAGLIVILALVDFYIYRKEAIFSILLAYLFLAYFNTLFIIYHDWVYSNSKNLEYLHAFIWFVSNAMTATILCFGLTLLLINTSLRIKILSQIIFFLFILLTTSILLHLIHMGHYRLERIIDDSNIATNILIIINILVYVYLIFMQKKLANTVHQSEVTIFLYLGIIQCTMSVYILFDVIKHFDTAYLGSSFLQLLCYFLVLVTLIARYFYSFVSMSTGQKNIIEEKNKFEQLSYQDSLTQLYNRRAFDLEITGRLAAAKQSQLSFSVLFLDINKFKDVNDTLGHDSGDELLKQIAERLKQGLESNNFLARIGGDEFALIITNLEDKDINEVITNLYLHFEEPFIINNHSYFYTISIGLSTFPKDGDTVQLLLKKADESMYKIKNSRKNRK